MAHNLNAIVTSFNYDGELPHVVLVGNFHLIAVNKRYGINYSEKAIEPFHKLTSKTRKQLKELSFQGKCIYFETHYFGGQGHQIAEVWHNGKRITDPLISFDGKSPTIFSGALHVDHAINEALKLIGIYKHEGKDEFDSVRLGEYRSNSDIVEEFEFSKK